MILSRPSWRGQYLPAGERYSVAPPVGIGGKRVSLGSVDLFGHCTGLLNPFNLVSPDCWAMAFPETLSPINAVSGWNVTQEQLQRPSSVYKLPPVFLPPPRPPVDLVTPPASEADANATVNGILSDQVRAGQGNAQQFFEDLNSDVNPSENPSSGLPGWLVPVLIVVGGLALIGTVKR